jgi:hypothetical protein
VPITCYFKRFSSIFALHFAEQYFYTQNALNIFHFPPKYPQHITMLRPPLLSQRLGCSSPMSLMAISSSQRLHLKLLATLKTLEEMDGLEPSRISPLSKVNLINFYIYLFIYSPGIQTELCHFHPPHPPTKFTNK